MHQIENSNNTLQKLMAEVSEQAARSADFIAPTTQIQIQTTHGKSVLTLEGSHGDPTRILTANEVCSDQIAQKAGIDAKTARRFREDYPDVYDHAIRRIWDQEPSKQMIRSFLNENERTGTARAFVSDKFKTFDNHHLLAAVLPQLMESDAQWQVVHGTVTEKRLYLRLKSEVITADRIANPFVGAMQANNWAGVGEDPNLPATRVINGHARAKGDVMALGIGLGNSEVGMGSVQIYQCVWTLACLNAMQTEHRDRQAHLTSARSDGDVIKYLTAEAIDADNKALTLKLRDLVAAYASRELFDEVLEKMRNAALDLIDAPLPDAVNNLGVVLKLTKNDTANVLEGLMQTLQQPGYSTAPASRATMVNAVTAVANNVSADKVDDWQKLGGKVLDLSPRDWSIVAKAA